MIWWVVGNSGSGKTTLANKMQAVRLDGDAMRSCWNLGFSKEDRYENNLRIAKIAKVIHDQGWDVVVSTICPYEELRNKVQEITGCKFVFLKGGDERGVKFEDTTTYTYFN